MLNKTNSIYTGESLSNYPSESILQALDDIIAVEKSKDLTVNMDYYFWPTDNGCSVCHVGAVLARRYRKDIRKVGISMSPTKQCIKPKTKEDRLLASQVDSFDELRQGHILYFLYEWIDIPAVDLKLLANKIKHKVGEWVTYEDSPKKYKSNLRKMAKILDREGY